MKSPNIPAIWYAASATRKPGWQPRNGTLCIHRDCDVLDAGLLATEYRSPNGLSYADLHEAFALLANHEVLGLEIAEYEASWPDTGRTCSSR